MGIRGRRVINKVISSVTALTLVMGMAITPYKTVFADTTEETEDEGELRYEYTTDSTMLNRVWTKEHSDVPFSERDPEELNVTIEDFEAAIANIEDAANNKGSDEIMAAFIDFCDLYDKYITRSNIYQVRYYQDMSNEEYKDKLNEIEQYSVDVSDYILTRFKDVVKIPAFTETMLPFFPEGTIEYIEDYMQLAEVYRV